MMETKMEGYGRRQAERPPVRKEGTEGYRPGVAPKAFKMIHGGKTMSDNEETFGSAVAASPVKNKVGSYFVPVRNIEASRSWYCKVLGLMEADCPIHFGHLCPLPMQGTGMILDTMPKWGGSDPDGAPSIQTPAFMLLTDKLEESLAYMKALGVRLVTEIEHDQWFVVLDPDGNKLMICRE
ncbi:VOC family protein [Paenibacillus sp. D51F]